MTQLLKLFAQIAMLRRGPQDLPASLLLLVVTVSAYLGVNVLVSSVFPPFKDWPPQLLLDTGFVLAWYAALLKVAGRPERTVQTTTAVFGFQTVLAPFMIASQWLMQRFIGDSTWELPLAFAGLVLVGWLIAANSRIVKAALDWSLTASLALVVLQIVAGELLRLALFYPPKS